MSIEAYLNEYNKLFFASLPKVFESGICDPVKITGFPKFVIKNETAEAVYTIVSVPCTTTKPS